MFSNTESESIASANIYSVIESWKANKIDTYKYLRFILTAIQKYRNDKDKLKELMPYNIYQ